MFSHKRLTLACRNNAHRIQAETCLIPVPCGEELCRRHVPQSRISGDRRPPPVQQGSRLPPPRRSYAPQRAGIRPSSASSAGIRVGFIGSVPCQSHCTVTVFDFSAGLFAFTLSTPFSPVACRISSALPMNAFRSSTLCGLRSMMSPFSTPISL